MVHLGTLVVGEDLATALSGAFNVGYFAGYVRRGGPSGRRMGAATLTLLSAAAVLEAVFSEALFWGAGLSTELWALARLPLLAATLAISILILRRLRS